MKEIADTIKLLSAVVAAANEPMAVEIRMTYVRGFCDGMENANEITTNTKSAMLAEITEAANKRLRELNGLEA